MQHDCCGSILIHLHLITLNIQRGPVAEIADFLNFTHSSGPCQRHRKTNAHKSQRATVERSWQNTSKRGQGCFLTTINSTTKWNVSQVHTHQLHMCKYTKESSKCPLEIEKDLAMACWLIWMRPAKGMLLKSNCILMTKHTHADLYWRPFSVYDHQRSINLTA